MKVYCYESKTREFVAEVEALPNGKSFFFPAFSTEIAPPETGKNETAVWTPEDGGWSIVPDFRGTAYWDAEGTERKIAELGEALPEGASLTPPPPPPPTPEEIQARLTSQIQQRLDDFARTRNYDGILSACTYATSTDPKFQAEGQYSVNARDATWAAAYAILDEALSGKRPVPESIADIDADLPALEWPK